MHTRTKQGVLLVGLLALTAVWAALSVAGCGGAGGSEGLDDLGADLADAPSAAPVDTAAASDAATAAPTLTLSLSTQLDTSPGAVKATSITQAELLNTAKTLVKTATIAGGAAQFDLTGLAAGHYFIRVNALASDLVPTKIDNPALSMTQFVGQKLRNSVIGTLASPKYRIETFSKGQAWPQVVRYSNGTAATPKGWAYVILQPGSKKMEIRYLQTAVLLTKHSHGGPHSFSTWMLGPTNHGKSTMNCASCHGSTSSHPASYSGINEGNGWCFKCHYGPTGPSKGMVKPTQ
ncbi:MAG: hypothetical protein FJX75_13230 [Armatimonadetes bacterium]|nr:hypothetical protein [Armatimonadota bacterium]